MDRRTFLKGMLAGAATAFLPEVSWSYDDLLNRLAKKGHISEQKEKFLINKGNLWYVPSQLRKNQSLDKVVQDKEKFHFVPKDEMVQGIWFYPGFETKIGFEKNPDVLARRVTDKIYAANYKSLKLLDEFNVNTVYVSALNHFNALDFYASKNDRRRHWADYKTFNHLIETFGLAANDPELKDKGLKPKEISILGYEDTVFLEWDQKKLQKHFRHLIQNTCHFARNYQIDVEPHAMDLKGNYFRNNKESRKQLIHQYMKLCDTMYHTAEEFNEQFKEQGINHEVRFIPAVPFIGPPHDVSMDYHEILKEEGYSGVDAIPCHELILMSYSDSAEKFYDMCINLNVEEINTPFTLASSNFPNVWDPYFKKADEHKDMPRQVKRIQAKNPNCRGYQIFCNLSLMNKDLPMKGR
ncbi:MAG: twin-arginine translocation signal domain-containing protein [Candidatus Woesearchaeota archaeon]